MKKTLLLSAAALSLTLTSAYASNLNLENKIMKEVQKRSLQEQMKKQDENDPEFQNLLARLKRAERQKRAHFIQQSKVGQDVQSFQNLVENQKEQEVNQAITDNNLDFILHSSIKKKKKETRKRYNGKRAKIQNRLPNVQKLLLQDSDNQKIKRFKDEIERMTESIKKTRKKCHERLAKNGLSEEKKEQIKTAKKALLKYLKAKRSKLKLKDLFGVKKAKDNDYKKNRIKNLKEKIEEQTQIIKKAKADLEQLKEEKKKKKEAKRKKKEEKKKKENNGSNENA